MARHRIVVEVDSEVLFERLSQMEQPSDLGPIGNRLMNSALCGAQPGMTDAVGLALYGFEVKAVTTCTTD